MKAISILHCRLADVTIKVYFTHITDLICSVFTCMNGALLISVFVLQQTLFFFSPAAGFQCILEFYAVFHNSVCARGFL